MGKIYVVGIGPGDIEMMTVRARNVLNTCDVIAGYKTYIELIREHFPDAGFYENGMKGERERCEKCVELAKAGKSVALICSGDAGVYGMASPLLEVAVAQGFSDIEIVPGVTAALSGGAVLGAPLAHDFCVISLSDLLTPWELIEKRLGFAAKADLCIAIYNPASHTRKDYLKRACEILMKELSPERACGWVRNIGRDGCSAGVCTLKELADIDADMFTTAFVGNSQTKIADGKLVTPRGYLI